MALLYDFTTRTVKDIFGNLSERHMGFFQKRDSFFEFDLL